MGNFCSREKENFDETLNSELNEIAKRKPGEQAEATENEVNFDNVEKLETNDIPSSDDGEDDAPSGLDIGDSNVPDEEAQAMKKRRQHFEKWVQDKIKGTAEYDESKGQKLYSEDFCCFLFTSAIFWMMVRTEFFKIRSRAARRQVLYGTNVPGGPGKEAADPGAEQIESYRGIVQSDFDNAMRTIDDTLSAILSIAELNGELFMKSWGLLAETAQGQSKQSQCFKDYEKRTLPTLTETQQKECNVEIKLLSEEDSLELFHMKNKIEIEILTDILDTKKMMLTIPDAAKQIVQDQLKNAMFLKLSMLADQIWWESAGKFEWFYVDKRLQAFVSQKLRAEDAVWEKRVEEFKAKITPIQTELDM